MAETPTPPPSAETYSAIGPMNVLPGADDLEIVLTRTLHASPERVYAAFTDPQLLQEWWGPEDFTVSQVQTDPRPSGPYRLVLRAPDGTEYPVSGIYVQADDPERVVMTDEAYEPAQDWEELHQEYRDEEDTPLRMIIRALFEEAEDGTALTLISRFPMVDDARGSLQAEATAIWDQSLKKLEQLLATQPAGVR